MLFFLIIFCFISNFGFSDSLVFNNLNNYNNSIYLEKNVELIINGNKNLYYKIRKNSVIKDNNVDKIDLYLSFDRDSKNDKTDNYKTLYKNYQFREKDQYINSSGFFYKEINRIDLEGNNKTIFRPGAIIPSFSINFWIYPLTYSGDQTVLKVGSFYYDIESNNIIEQSMKVVLSQGFLNVKMINMFKSNEEKINPEINLKSIKMIEPNKWTNINISYNMFTAEFYVYVDGKINITKLFTEDGTYNSSKLNMVFNSKNRCIISLGSNFVGSIDEFVIKNNSNEVSNQDKQYSYSGGEIVSKVIMLDRYPVTINKITFDQSENGNGEAVKYYIRYSNDNFLNEDVEYDRKRVNWVLYDDRVGIIKAKYIQWKALLLPSVDSDSSPKFIGLKLDFERDHLPQSPKGLVAYSKDNKIFIRWTKNSERDIKGYKLYYGLTSNNYFCNDASEGESPIIVGNKTSYVLTNLDLNKVYYIRITTYDDNNGEHESEFSDEIYVRVN